MIANPINTVDHLMDIYTHATEMYEDAPRKGLVGWRSALTIAMAAFQYPAKKEETK